MRRFLRYLLLTVVVVGLILGASAYAYQQTAHTIGLDAQSPLLPAPENAHTVVFVVRPGESAQSIGQRLQDEGLIQSALLFRFLVNLFGVATRLEAGNYPLAPDMPTTEIIRRLYRGLPSATAVQVPEGWRGEEVAAALRGRPGFDEGAFLGFFRHPTFDYSFVKVLPAGSTLEGYLFPDTYFAPADYDAESIIRLMLDDFQRRFTPEMAAKAQARGLTMHQVVTLASIVEREAAQAEERPVIASVFLNRLKAGMPLQADPTVQYSLWTRESGSPFWKSPLSTQDLQANSPYNTYLRPGLPPGPIANPGLSAIEAVLEPADSEFFYFAARGDGTHVFSRTLEEHNANIARLRATQ